MITESNESGRTETVPEWAIRAWTALSVLAASPDFPVEFFIDSLNQLVQSAPANLQMAGSIYGLTMMKNLEKNGEI